MSQTTNEIEYYKAPNGTVPFDKWINNLSDVKGRAIVRIRLGRIFRGLFGDCKSIGTGLYELKVQYGPGYRIYFGRLKNRIVILTAGNKSSQKKDIKIAQAYWADYGG